MSEEVCETLILQWFHDINLGTRFWHTRRV